MGGGPCTKETIDVHYIIPCDSMSVSSMNVFHCFSRSPGFFHGWDLNKNISGFFKCLLKRVVYLTLHHRWVYERNVPLLITPICMTLSRLMIQLDKKVSQDRCRDTLWKVALPCPWVPEVWWHLGNHDISPTLKLAETRWNKEIFND